MLLPKQYATPWPRRLGLAAMLVLLLLAWHFYQERVAYADLSYHLVTFIRSKTLFIQNRRFVATVTQWPTLLATQAGLPLDSVMRLYSVVFVLYYLAIFMLCAYWLKNEQVALLVPLLFLLLASRTFYWAQSEFPQGLVVLLLFYAGLSRLAPLRLGWHLLGVALLVPVIIFSHPLIIMPFVFLWGYDWLLNRRGGDRLYWGILGLGLLIYLYRQLTIPAGSYEAQANNFGGNLREYFPYYLSLRSFEDFARLCVGNFVALPVLVLVLAFYYLRQGERMAFLRLGWILGFVLGYAFIICISYPNYVEPTYLENLFLPLGLFVAVPAALELLPALERWQLARGGLRRGATAAALLVGLVLAARLGVVWHMRHSYVAQVQWLKQLLAYGQQFPERRYFLSRNNVDPSRLRASEHSWASPYETMVLSARNSPDSTQTAFITDDLARVVPIGQEPGVQIGPWEVFRNWDFPPQYFRLPEATAYRLLNTPPPADTAALRPYIEARKAISLSFVGAPALSAGQLCSALVRVRVPAAARPLHSGLSTPFPTMLRVSFLSPDAWPVPGVEPLEVPLDVDITTPWAQLLPLRCPAKSGQYLLVVQLISKGYRDWPVQLRETVNLR